MKTLGLRGRILGTAACTLAGVLVAVTIYNSRSDERVIAESRRMAEDLTQAMQVSVQQLGSNTEPDADLLRDYTRRLGRTGVRQIEILDPDKRFVAGSHDKAHTYLIEEETGAAPPTWDLLVPVVTGPDKLGYVQLHMSSSNFESLLRRIRRRRSVVTAFAFGGGLVLAGLLASQITRPVDALRIAAQRIAKGELDVPLPTRKADDEIGGLVRAFHEMVAGLRDRASLRRKLDAAERDALLGRVAATMAHDVRNPLNYLSLAVGHLLATSAKTAESDVIGEQIKKELQRANDRIGEFLRLGKPVEVRPSEIAVRPLLEAVAASCSSRRVDAHTAGNGGAGREHLHRRGGRPRGCFALADRAARSGQLARRAVGTAARRAGHARRSRARDR